MATPSTPAPPAQPSAGNGQASYPADLPVNANLHQRMNWVQKQVDYVQKNKPAGLKYSIVSHDAVTATVRPFMVTADILAYPCSIDTNQNGDRTEMRVCMRFVNIDNPQDTFDVETLGYGVDNSDKGPGKAMSYAVKYAYLKAFGLETGDDPDTDQTVVHTPQAKTDITRNIEIAEKIEDLAEVPTAIKTSNLSQADKSLLEQKYRAKYRALSPKGAPATAAPPAQQPADDFPGDR